MSFLPVILQIALLLLVAIAAVYDIRFRRIPNWLVLTGLLAGVVLNTLLLEWSGVRASLLGISLAFLIYFPLYLLRGMGAGDVKLMAAVGAIAGPLNWLGIMVLTALFGGVAAIVLVTAKGRVHKTFENIRMILLSARHLQAPYDANPDLDV